MTFTTHACVQPGFIIGVSEFLAPHECDAMIGFVSEIGLNPPSPKDLHPKRGEAYLCRESFAFSDANLGAALFERMKALLPQASIHKQIRSQIQYHTFHVLRR
jgi:hypothetical protein